MKNNVSPTEAPVSDDVLREVWRIKNELSVAYGHDINRPFAEARARQQKSGRPSVNLQKKSQKRAVRLGQEDTPLG